MAILVLLLAGSVVAVILWQRSNKERGLWASTQDLAVRRVTVIHPTSGEADNEIVLPGNLMAYTEAPIFSRTNGYLKSWSTDIGAKVKEGQVLGVIEAPDVDAQLRQASAALAQAQSNQEIADLDFARQQELLSKRVVSQQEFDQARTNMDAAKAAVRAAEANVENLKVQQGFQMLVAPFDGIVTRRNTDVGALISASNGGQELFRVARTDILRVYVYVPQAYADFVKEGARAYLSFDELPGRKFEGTVAHISGSLDPSTRTLETQIQVDNRSGELFPGAFSNVHLLLVRKPAPIIIPINLLIFRSEGSEVATVTDQSTVHLRKVSIGHDYGTTLEVIDGLSKDDRIVMNPPDSLAEGDTVQIQGESASQQPKRATGN